MSSDTDLLIARKTHMLCHKGIVNDFIKRTCLRNWSINRLYVNTRCFHNFIATSHKTLPLS